MRRLTLTCLVSLFILISACSPEAPIPTEDPTPTQEIAEFRVVNSNPYFVGENVERRLPSSDSLRYQVVTRPYEPIYRYPVWAEVTIPPYINRIMRDDGSGRSILHVEFAQIQGEFGIETQQFFEGGVCHYIKQVGYLNVPNGNMQNLSAGARLEYPNGSSLELRLQAFPSRRGYYELIWLVRPSEDITMTVELYTYARFAEYTGEVYNDIEAFLILEAPDSQCPDDATFDF